MGFELLEKFDNSLSLYKNEEEKVTYKELAIKSDQIVSNLPARTLFGLYFHPSINCIATYLGALRNNHVPVLIDPFLDQNLKNKILDKFKVRFIFDGSGWEIKDNFSEEKLNLNQELAVLLSTSGSTGSPKLIKISLKNLNNNAMNIVKYMGLNSNDRAISSLPLHYSYGLSILNTHLLVGAKFFLSEEPITNKFFWEFFRNNKITNLAGVPTTWRILRKLFFERMSLPHLRIISQAGGKLSKEEISWLSKVSKSKDYILFIMYGQTEATARISYLEPSMIDEKTGSIGKAIPGGELFLKDDKGSFITDANVQGELVYKGENIMLGYSQGIDDLAKGRDIKELHTGDIAFRDEDDFYWVTGRKKRFIKLFGNRFNLDDIEDFLNDQGIESYVIGKDDNLKIILNKASTTNQKDLIKKISDFYKIHFSVIEIIQLDNIPKNTSGKTEYKKLENICFQD